MIQSKIICIVTMIFHMCMFLYISIIVKTQKCNKHKINRQIDIFLHYYFHVHVICNWGYKY